MILLGHFTNLDTTSEIEVTWNESQNKTILRSVHKDCNSLNENKLNASEIFIETIQIFYTIHVSSIKNIYSIHIAKPQFR